MKKQLTLSLITLLSVLFISPTEAAPVFEYGDERNKIDFTALAPGASITTLDWSKGRNTSTAVGVTPRAPASSPGLVVLGAPETTDRVSSVSPAQVLAVPFATSDTVYFSMLINTYSSASSGVRFAAGDWNDDEGAFRPIVGFGASDTNPIGALTVFDGEKWVTTAGKIIESSKWYELTLVIQQNSEDLSKSLGYLFYRDVTGNGPMTLVDEAGFNGFSVELSDTFNLSTFSRWEVSSFRYLAQVASISAGVGTIAIPEASSFALFGSTALILGLICHKRRQL